MNRPPMSGPCFLLADRTNGEERRAAEQDREKNKISYTRVHEKERTRGRIAQYASTFPSTKVPRGIKKARLMYIGTRRTRAMISSQPISIGLSNRKKSFTL